MKVMNNPDFGPAVLPQDAPAPPAEVPPAGPA
jgi:hypothetical protein